MSGREVPLLRGVVTVRIGIHSARVDEGVFMPDPKIMISPLSGTVTIDGIMVEVATDRRERNL